MIINYELMQNRKRIREMQQNKTTEKNNHIELVLILCRKFYQIIAK